MTTFLQAILAEPQDDALRLIYADWLEENGQEARAEFIRAQIAIAVSSDSLEHPLWPRVGQLLRENRGWAPQWMLSYSWKRGFVYEVSCTCQAWMEHGPRLVQEQPLERVELSDARTVRGVSFEMGRWGGLAWVWSHLPMPGCLPDGLYDSVTKAAGHSSFPNLAAAQDALSKGCLLWARQKALRREKKAERRSVG